MIVEHAKVKDINMMVIEAHRQCTCTYKQETIFAKQLPWDICILHQNSPRAPVPQVYVYSTQFQNGIHANKYDLQILVYTATIKLNIYTQFTTNLHCFTNKK